MITELINRFRTNKILALVLFHYTLLNYNAAFAEGVVLLEQHATEVENQLRSTQKEIQDLRQQLTDIATSLIQFKTELQNAKSELTDAEFALAQIQNNNELSAGQKDRDLFAAKHRKRSAVDNVESLKSKVDKIAADRNYINARIARNETKSQDLQVELITAKAELIIASKEAAEQKLTEQAPIATSPKQQTRQPESTLPTPSPEPAVTIPVKTPPKEDKNYSLDPEEMKLVKRIKEMRVDQQSNNHKSSPYTKLFIHIGDSEPSEMRYDNGRIYTFSQQLDEGKHRIRFSRKGSEKTQLFGGRGINITIDKENHKKPHVIFANFDNKSKPSIIVTTERLLAEADTMRTTSKLTAK